MGPSVVNQFVSELKVSQIETGRVRNLKFNTSKTLVNSMMKMMLCLKLGLFHLKNLDLLYIQQTLTQFTIFISISKCGEFRYVANIRFLTLNITE